MGASLSALSPAISECDGLVASLVPAAAAVLVAAISSGVAAGGRRAAVFAIAEPGSSDAVDSMRGFSSRRADSSMNVAVFAAAWLAAGVWK